MVSLPGSQIPSGKADECNRDLSSTISIVSGCHLKRLRRFVPKGKARRDHPKKDDAALLCAKVRYSSSREARQPQPNFPAGPPQIRGKAKGTQGRTTKRTSHVQDVRLVFNASWTSPCYLAEKLNRSNKSPMAGVFNGTYGLLLLATGLGKLSRLRVVTGARSQLRSTNFRIET